MSELKLKVKITVTPCDLWNPEHRKALLMLMDLYALDPMSGGHSLTPRARQNLIPQLQRHPSFYGWVAYYGQAPAGFAICFLNFSTFAGLPALNIHDISVRNEYRGGGLGKRILETIESKARELECCKLTLEVREDNGPARRLYQHLDFARMVVGEQGKPMEFWEKLL